MNYNCYPVASCYENQKKRNLHLTVGSTENFN
ncbi:hypothetical protein CLU83_0923 [Flavobacterium sp. 1]|nr:hypothetical protein CLU83_0923 [Flavobacterium sp. 1]